MNSTELLQGPWVSLLCGIAMRRPKALVRIGLQRPPRKKLFNKIAVEYLDKKTEGKKS